jgi:hypothetical protein
MSKDEWYWDEVLRSRKALVSMEKEIALLEDIRDRVKILRDSDSGEEFPAQLQLLYDALDHYTARKEHP